MKNMATVWHYYWRELFLPPNCPDRQPARFGQFAGRQYGQYLPVIPSNCRTVHITHCPVGRSKVWAVFTGHTVELSNCLADICQMPNRPTVLHHAIGCHLIITHISDHPFGPELMIKIVIKCRGAWRRVGFRLVMHE